MEKILEKNEIKKEKAIFAYLPAILSAVLGGVTLILYYTVIPEQRISTLLGIIGILFVPFAAVFLNRRWNLGFPPILMDVICAQCVLSVDAGSALGLYELIPWWDLFLHGLFGFWCCAAMYYLYLRVRGEKPGILGYLVLVLLVTAMAAFWEIYEFTVDMVAHTDMQRVQEAIEKGLPAMSDTMTDLIIAIAGAIVYALALCLKESVVKTKLRRADATKEDVSEKEE